MQFSIKQYHQLYYQLLHGQTFPV